MSKSAARHFVPYKPQALSLSAVDAVVEQIRRIISEANLGVGDRLPTERELCIQCAASRNTVREAMRILKAYGMVDVRPKVGAVIIDNRMSRAFDLLALNTMEVSPKTYLDIQSLRDLLEVGAADQLIERASDRDVAELRDINQRLLGNRDIESAAETDHAFHLRILQILDNAAILDIYGVFKPVILKIMAKGKTRRVYETQTYSEHEGVIDAIEARDRLGYQYRLRTHLMDGARYFQEEAIKAL